jgi:hypothetical protein
MVSSHTERVHTGSLNSCHPDKKQVATIKDLASQVSLSVSRMASLQRSLQYLEAGLLHKAWEIVLEKCIACV